MLDPPATKVPWSRPCQGARLRAKRVRTRSKLGGHEARSDAGASAGDEPRSKAAFKVRGPQGKRVQGASGRWRDTGRQARGWKSDAGGLARMFAGPKRPRAGESGVGRNAGPICFGFDGKDPSILFPARAQSAGSLVLPRFQPLPCHFFAIEFALWRASSLSGAHHGRLSDQLEACAPGACWPDAPAAKTRFVRQSDPACGAPFRFCRSAAGRVLRAGCRDNRGRSRSRRRGRNGRNARSGLQRC